MKAPTIRQQSAARFGAWDLDTATDTDDWRGAAACRPGSGIDPELFHPIGDGALARAQTELAKAVCRRCPVSADCLADALERGIEYGIFGAHTEDERRALRRQQQRDQQQAPDAPDEDTTSREYREAHRLCLKCGDALPATAGPDRRLCDDHQLRPARCGTSGGYWRHMKKKTPMCDPCRDTYNTERREQYQERRKQPAGAA